VANATWCNPVEVMPRVSSNCTEEIPVTWNTTSLFVDLISYVIKSAASPTQYNDIAPPMWNTSRALVLCIPCHPECAPPRDLAVEAVHIALIIFNLLRAERINLRGV
jgi:hypothetical protein